METTSHEDVFMARLFQDISFYASTDSDGDADSAGGVAEDEDGDDTAADAATAAAIAALQTAEAPADDCCPICLRDEEEEPEASTPAAWKRIAACGHRFHGGCVETWLKVKLSCPVCRCPAAVATVEEILEIYGDYSDSFEASLRQAMAGPSTAGSSGLPSGTC